MLADYIHLPILLSSLVRCASFQDQRQITVPAQKQKGKPEEAVSDVYLYVCIYIRIRM